MRADPGKRNAAPSELGHGSFGKHSNNFIFEPAPQALTPTTLEMEWKIASEGERFQFLRSVRESALELWRDVERDFVASKSKEFIVQKGHAIER